VIKRVTPRSYLVKGRVFRRNHRFLRLIKERYVSDFDDGLDSIIGRKLCNDVNDSPQRSVESNLNCDIPVRVKYQRQTFTHQSNTASAKI